MALKGSSVMTTFNVKELNAETANLVGKNQTNVSGPGAQYAHLKDATREVAILRRQLRRLDLPPEALEDAELEMAGLNAELMSARPDQNKMNKRLKRLTTLLGNVGALAAAGQALAVPLDNLARWIGTQF
jgi:hypothetical protein